jgi:hypothetical protein
MWNGHPHGFKRVGVFTHGSEVRIFVKNNQFPQLFSLVLIYFYIYAYCVCIHLMFLFFSNWNSSAVYFSFYIVSAKGNP